uniref:GDNF-inducible zinc finger protein 1 n=1 Tax=Cacopsylla melanoneura TaxID=428564 RepID=A0A8D9EX25_9HEMI
MDSDENDGNPKTGSTKVTTKSRGRQKKKGSSQTKTKGSSRLNVQDRLSDKVQDELIRQVEKRPAMYDPDHKDNGRKQTITYWDSIADEIRDLTGENIGGDVLKQKWRELRTFFVRLYRIREAGTNLTYLENKRDFMNKMKFVIPYFSKGGEFTPTIHECKQCEAKFRHKYKLRIHVEKNHAAAKSHACTQCTAQFSYDYMLRNHVREVHEGVNYECASCAQVFNHRQVLLFHIKAAHGPRNLVTCEVCSKQVNKRRLKTHMRYHSDQKWKCDTCWSLFATKHTLQRHILRRHTSTKNFPCVVPDCKKKFSVVHDLKAHVIQCHSVDEPR